jgi:hypothetical protein
MRRPLVVLTVLLALVVAAGCGGGGDGSAKPASKVEYGREVLLASQAFQKAFAATPALTTPGTSDTVLARGLDQGATALDEAAGKFKAMTPPKAAEADHRKLVGGFNALATAFHRAAAAAHKSDDAALAKALGGISTAPAVKAIDGVEADLERKGIHLTPTGK